MTPYTLKWQIPPSYEGKLMRQFLIDQQISKRTLTSVKFEGGLLTVNGEKVNVRHRLKEGDLLQLTFPPEKGSGNLVGQDVPLTIIYEDNDLLVIDKPSGVAAIPSKDYPNKSLANQIIAYYQHCRISSTVHIVTRLDRDTSGLVLVAKHRHVHHLFSLQQQENQIKRLYEAFAQGTFPIKTGTIDKPIGRKDHSIIEREVRADGKYARTDFEVINEFQNFTHLLLKLETGRTHQIRVHLSSIGHPLVGDDLYGGSLQLLTRQALHCRFLTFFHPLKKEWMAFESSLASDMKGLLHMDEKR